MTEWHDARAEWKPYGNDERIYLITDGATVSVGEFTFGDEWWDWCEGLHHADITHWAVLPKPPAKEESNAR